MKKANPQKIIRENIKIDANNQSIGRIATQAAIALCGKNKPTFNPAKNGGNFVQIINASKVKFTGKKLDQKKYFHFSGYPGGLKEKKLNELFKKSPEKVIWLAVYRMLPKNKLRDKIIKLLKIAK